MIRENNLTTNDLIWPIFLAPKTQSTELMPDVFVLSIEDASKEIEHAIKLGIPAVAIFPQIDQDKKNNKGSFALDENNIICTAIKKFKQQFSDEIGIICDVALDPYTDHGHDGVLDSNGYVDNDLTVEILCQQALLQASCGCDILAPSDMMDGRVATIRETLETNNYHNTIMVPYAVKYASTFYNPFRNVMQLKGNIDKQSYQVDISNSEESMREIALDVQEGADAIILKPSMIYGDIIRQTKDNFNIPIYAYQVSGEYSMLKLASKNNIFDEDKVFLECLISLKRAGADGIITYAAKKIAKLLKDTSNN